MPRLKELSCRLNELAKKLDCQFIDNIPSFTYGDGEMDTSLFNDDGVHLSRKGTAKFTNNLTRIGPICFRDSTGPSNGNILHRQKHRQYERMRHKSRWHERNNGPSDTVFSQENVPHRHTNRQQSFSYHQYRGCFNCGERNHSEGSCRFDVRIQCHKCHRYGHKASMCWTKSI